MIGNGAFYLPLLNKHEMQLDAVVLPGFCRRVDEQKPGCVGEDGEALMAEAPKRRRGTSLVSFTEGVTPHLGVSYSEASSSSKVGESLASPLPSIIDSSSSAFVPRMELAVAASKSVMRRWRRSYRVLNFLVRFFY
jgi:hypothetical protein